MIVAIVDRKIVAHADTVTECAEKVLFGALDSVGLVRYRPASPALQALIESGASTEGLALVIGETVDLAESRYQAAVDRFLQREREDIRRIREHVIARTLENTK